MKTHFGIVLKEKPLDEGLTHEEVNDLFDMLTDTECIPYEVQAENSTAMGFINLTDADYLDFNYAEGSPIYSFIQSILEDMDKESETGEYAFSATNGDIDIYITR